MVSKISKRPVLKRAFSQWTGGSLLIGNFVKSSVCILNPVQLFLRAREDCRVDWEVRWTLVFLCSCLCVQLQTSEGKVNSLGLEVGTLKSKLQEKSEQSQQLQDQILKQQEALSRAGETLKDTRKAAGNKVKGVEVIFFSSFSLSSFLFLLLSERKKKEVCVCVFLNFLLPCDGEFPRCVV